MATQEEYYPLRIGDIILLYYNGRPRIREEDTDKLERTRTSGYVFSELWRYLFCISMASSALRAIYRHSDARNKIVDQPRLPEHRVAPLRPVDLPNVHCRWNRIIQAVGCMISLFKEMWLQAVGCMISLFKEMCWFIVVHQLRARAWWSWSLGYVPSPHPAFCL